MADVSISGGGKWQRVLAKIAGQHVGVRVGILEGAGSAKDGTHLASIGAIHEFGGTATIPARTQTLKFRKKKNKNGKTVQVFTKKSAKRPSKTMDVEVGAHDVVIPSRPFMRNTVKNKKAEWAKKVANFMNGKPDRATAAFHAVGHLMAADVQSTIEAGVDPKLKQTTVQSKKAKKAGNPELPLVLTGDMMKSISFEVVGGKDI